MNEWMNEWMASAGNSAHIPLPAPRTNSFTHNWYQRPKIPLLPMFQVIFGPISNDI